MKDINYKILNDFNNGIPLLELSKKYNISLNVIYYYLNRFKIKKIKKYGDYYTSIINYFNQNYFVDKINIKNLRLVIRVMDYKEYQLRSKKFNKQIIIDLKEIMKLNDEYKIINEIEYLLNKEIVNKFKRNNI